MNKLSWILPILTGSLFLAIFYLYKNEELFNFMGWSGLVLGAILWWKKEKEDIERITRKK